MPEAAATERPSHFKVETGEEIQDRLPILACVSRLARRSLPKHAKYREYLPDDLSVSARPNSLGDGLRSVEGSKASSASSACADHLPSPARRSDLLNLSASLFSSAPTESRKGTRLNRGGIIFRPGIYAGEISPKRDPRVHSAVPSLPTLPLAKHKPGVPRNPVWPASPHWVDNATSPKTGQIVVQKKAPS